MRLQAAGLRVDLPRGWEGRLRGSLRAASADRAPEPVVMQAANFALPPTVGDFGGGAVETMTSRDLFLALFEYGPESAGTALFARQGMPRVLRPTDLHPFALRTPLPGMSGTQVFFTEGGRPFCLYVAVGSHTRRFRTLPVLSSILQTVDFAH